MHIHAWAVIIIHLHSRPLWSVWQFSSYTNFISRIFYHNAPTGKVHLHYNPGCIIQEHKFYFQQTNISFWLLPKICFVLRLSLFNPMYKCNIYAFICSYLFGYSAIKKYLAKKTIITVRKVKENREKIPSPAVTMLAGWKQSIDPLEARAGI